VERRLASDESYRQQLQGVERAWKALDELPLPVVDDQFSRTTMQLAVQAAVAEVQEKTAALPIQRRRSQWATCMTYTNIPRSDTRRFAHLTSSRRDCPRGASRYTAALA
jgi:hypothetical protein